MADNTMSERPCHGVQLAAEAAEILDTANIDYVCFGWLAVALLAHDAGFGVSTMQRAETGSKTGFATYGGILPLDLVVGKNPWPRGLFR